MKWTATRKTMETEMNSMSLRKHSNISMKQRWALWQRNWMQILRIKVKKKSDYFFLTLENHSYWYTERNLDIKVEIPKLFIYSCSEF